MEKKENIKEYLQKMLDRWNKYDVLDGFVAESFRVDLEKTLEYWDLRIADNKEELDKAREEGKLEYILSLGWQDTDNEYVKEVLEDAERIAEKLSKLKE